MALLLPVPGQPKSSQAVQQIATPESSSLASLIYDANTMQLTIEFKNGSQYTHFYVFPAVFQELIQAPSKGSYYARNIKGKYATSRIIDKRSPARHEPSKPHIQKGDVKK